jgi:hypothetical protein
MQLWTAEGGRGQYFHVIGRTAGRIWCLDDEAKTVFVDLMRKTEQFTGVEVVTWTLMDNHYHLVLHVPDAESLGELPEDAFWERLGALYSKEQLQEIEARIATFHRLNPGLTGVAQEKAYREGFLGRMHSLSEFMKTLLQRFSAWFNKRHDRVGRLWEQRFKSVVIEGGWDPLMNVAAYVDLNAVRAGLVEDPKDYRWCGYAEAVAGSRQARRGLGHLMREDAMRNQSGVPDWRVVGREYRKLLFGVGEERPAADGDPGRKGISAEKVAKVQASGGVLPLPRLLRCRVRYFSDGVVIGSRRFVNDFFEAKREFFGAKRKDGARKLRGGDFGALRSLRDLRKGVPSPAG